MPEKDKLAVMYSCGVHEKAYVSADVLSMTVYDKRAALTEHYTGVFGCMGVVVAIAFDADYRHFYLVAEQHKLAQSVPTENKIIGLVDKRYNANQIIRPVVNIRNNNQFVTHSDLIFQPEISANFSLRALSALYRWLTEFFSSAVATPNDL